MQENNNRGESLIDRLRFTPTLHPVDGFDGFAINRDDLARMMASRTEAANLLEANER